MASKYRWSGIVSGMDGEGDGRMVTGISGKESNMSCWSVRLGSKSRVSWRRGVRGRLEEAAGRLGAPLGGGRCPGKRRGLLGGGLPFRACCLRLRSFLEGKCRELYGRLFFGAGEAYITRLLLRVVERMIQKEMVWIIWHTCSGLSGEVFSYVVGVFWSTV